MAIIDEWRAAELARRKEVEAIDHSSHLGKVQLLDDSCNPSDINSTTVEQLRDDHFAEKLGKYFKLPPLVRGPHESLLFQFLRHFVETQYERPVWDFFRQRYRHNDADRKLIESAAIKVGLSFDEFNSRETLQQLKRFCAAKAIAMPPQIGESSPLKTIAEGMRHETSSDESPRELRRGEQLALSGYSQAETLLQQRGERATDRAAYDCLIRGEIEGFDARNLPEFSAWARQLRSARKKTDQQKNRPRVTGGQSRSIQKRRDL